MAAPWRTQNNFYRKHLYNVMQLYRQRPDLRMFTEIILSLAAIIVFGIFAIRPTLVTVATLIQEIETKEEVVAQLDQKVQNLSLAQQVYQDNIEAITLLNTSVPSKPVAQEFIRQLEALVSKNSVTLNTMVFENINLRGEALSSVNTNSENQNTPLSNNASEISFSVTITGTYPNVENFVKDIENLLMVNLINKSNIATTELNNNLTLTISGRIPYIKKQ